MNNKIENIANFESIFKEYFNPLVNYVNSRLNNWDDSKEIVQQTFYKFWKNRERIQVHTDIKGYLYQSCRNTMIDFIRARKPISEVEALENVTYSDDDEGIDPYLIKQCILKVLKKMKPRMQEIFELSKFQGLTYQEIADRLEISKRTVEDNIARSLIILKDELKKSEIYYEK